MALARRVVVPPFVAWGVLSPRAPFGRGEEGGLRGRESPRPWPRARRVRSRGVFRENRVCDFRGQSVAAFRSYAVRAAISIGHQIGFCKFLDGDGWLTRRVGSAKDPKFSAKKSNGATQFHATCLPTKRRFVAAEPRLRLTEHQFFR